MRSAKRLLLVAFGALAMLMVLSGPALAHTLSQKNGKPHGHGCGYGIEDQTTPRHRTHKHVHVGAHHADVHWASEKHFHDHVCQPQPVEIVPVEPSPSPSPVAAVSRPAGGSGDGAPAGIVIFAALAILTSVVVPQLLPAGVRKR